MEQPKGNPIDKNLILDEAINKLNSLQSELLIKNACIRQLQGELATLKQQQSPTQQEEQKEETL
jgi:hypothetical protein